MRSIFQMQTLAVRITALVLTILVVFTLALGFTVFQITSNWLEETAVTGLEALASVRQAAIEAQLDNYVGTQNAFMQPNLETDVEGLLAASNAERPILHDKLAASMRRKMSADQFLGRAEIVDLNGAVFASTAPDRQGLQLTDSAAFTEGQIRPFISVPFAENGTIYMELSHPLRDGQNNTIAVLMLRFNSQQLLAITGDYTGLGDTGETVLGTRRGKEIYFLAPLRFDPNLSDIEPAPANGERAKPMIHATAGQSGVTRAPDYRDVRVIAAFRPIESVGWGVVVKQDEIEALADVSQLRNTLFIGVGILLLLGVIVTLFLTRVFTQPLRDLERATRQVATGDLTASVPVSQLDEVGQLAESFNNMVAKLREAHENLARSNQELASFAYVVSHDLKAPLRGIASLSEWLEEDLEDKLDADQHMQMRLLRERVHRMDALINGLLEYSRVGRVKNPTISVSVETLLDHVIDSLSPPDDIQIIVTPPMPTLQTDELRLSQVFQNLIGNAVKYHPGPQGRVEINYRDADTHWEFAVSDDGEGIESRYHERIFQMFQTLNSNQSVESTGIGLALVKKIVEEHGGEVWIESDGVPGKGATFYFTWLKN